MKVLYLTPWYPSDKDAMLGLFIRKHVEAVRTQGVEVRVIHSDTWSSTWSQWHSIRKEGWIPDVVQLNIIQKQGLLALYLKRRYHIPYIIVEHWSGYLPENGMFMQMSAAKKRLYQHIAAEAACILPVSHTLQEAMLKCGLANSRWHKINNVVDDFFYRHNGDQETDSSVKTLLHVSCFDERAKNVKSLLCAAKMLSEKRQDWQLVLVGDGVDYKEIRAYAESLEIPKHLLRWTGELTPSQVAKEMHKADAFVLTSRYETYGVVLAEAAAAGLPILSTPVGIAKDLVNKETGIIVSQENANRPNKLSKYMETIMAMPKYILQEKQFTTQAIGLQLKNMYEQCLVSV